MMNAFILIQYFDLKRDATCKSFIGHQSSASCAENYIQLITCAISNFLVYKIILYASGLLLSLHSFASSQQVM
jgi:hypothetical protein